MKNQELLFEIGLTERESKVYIALLEIGLTTAGPIIKKSGVPNSKIYEILESLHNKGLISWIVKGKIKYFQASEPKKLLSIFEEKKKEIEQLIPNLELKMLKSKYKNSVELFEDIKAIRSASMELLSNSKQNSIQYSFTQGYTSTNEEIRILYEWMGRLRREYKIQHLLLVSEKNKNEFITSHKDILKEYKNKRDQQWKLRFSKIPFPGDIGILNDKILIMSWEEPITLVVITNKSLAEQYREFFLEIWSKAEKYL